MHQYELCVVTLTLEYWLQSLYFLLFVSANETKVEPKSLILESLSALQQVLCGVSTCCVYRPQESVRKKKVPLSDVFVLVCDVYILRSLCDVTVTVFCSQIAVTYLYL